MIISFVLFKENKHTNFSSILKIKFYLEETISCVFKNMVNSLCLFKENKHLSWLWSKYNFYSEESISHVQGSWNTVAIGNQFFLTGDSDFNFLDSIHFLLTLKLHCLVEKMW